MKTTIVPAQITTVEDRIAGSLTLPQITLTVVSLIIGAGIYAEILPKMHLGVLKLFLIVIQCAIFGTLAIRYNGKIVADWLIVYLRYKSRPNKYVFTKKDLVYREVFTKKATIKTDSIKTNARENKNPIKPLTLLERIDLEKILGNNSLTISFKPSKKGGLDVLLKQKED